MTESRSGYHVAQPWYGLTAASLRRWRWRRAATVAGAGPARYAKVGDSISAGQGLQPSTQSPPVVMAGMLAAHGLPDRGASVIMNPRTRMGDSRLLFRGAWSELDVDALTTYVSSRTAGDAIEFTASIAQSGDHRLRVIHLAESRPFEVSVDGGDAVQVGPVGGSGPVVTELTLPEFVAGEHRVRITVTGDAGVLQVGSIGIESASGIAIGDFGISMSTTDDWVADGAPHSALQHVLAWAPDLAIIALMTNDAHHLAVPPDRYAANLRTMVDALMETSDVVLEVQIPGDPALVDLAPYRAAVYAVADATGVPVLDLFERWGDFAAAREAGLMNDMFHPNATGAADIAAAEFAVVTA